MSTVWWVRLPLSPKPGLFPGKSSFGQDPHGAHTTEVGFCVHDYTMSPCQLHRDCLNCEELVCVKGDVIKATAIRRQYAETQTLLAQALEAAKQEYSGANRWVEHQQHTLERLDQLCKILDDPDVPDGTLMQLSARRQAPRLGRQMPGVPGLAGSSFANHVERSVRALGHSTPDDSREINK